MENIYKKKEKYTGGAGTDIIQEQEATDPYIVSNDPNGPVYSLLNKQKQETESDYYEKQKRLEGMKRVNALSDTFRLLADTVGLSKGASVQKRQPNTQLDQASQQLMQQVQANKANNNRQTLSLAMQKAKAKEIEDQKKQALRDYAEQKRLATEAELPILEQKFSNTMAELEARTIANESLANTRGKQAMDLAKYKEGQANARFNKNYYLEKQKAIKSAQERGLYELNDNSGQAMTKIDQAGIDKMITAINSDPVLKNDFDVMMGRMPDGLSNDTEKRLYVQKFWQQSPALQNLAKSLNRSASITNEAPQNAPEQVIAIGGKLAPVIDIIDSKFEEIKKETLVDGNPDYTQRFRKLYNLLLVSKDRSGNKLLTPEEAKAFAEDMVYND